MYYFIVNPNACHGNGGRIWKKLRRRLDCLGAEYDALLTENTGDAARYAAQLTAHCAEPRLLIAVGGDGTVNEVVNGLAFEGPITLGYIPAGTGNDLARSLRLSSRWKKDLRNIMNPKYHRLLDYGIVSIGNREPVHRRFMVSCGIGLDAAVCCSMLETAMPKHARGLLGPRIGRFRYVLKGLQQLIKSIPVRGYLLLDGTRRVELNRIRFVSAHIHPYEGGGFCFAPKAVGDDGLLDICVVHGESGLMLIPMLIGAWLGRSPRNRHIRRYICHDLQVHVERPMPVHTDGEMCGNQTDITLGCVEKKVRFIV